MMQSKASQMISKLYFVRIVQEHPALAQAASHVIAAVTEDTNTRELSQSSNSETAEMVDLERADPGVKYHLFSCMWREKYVY